MILWQIVCLQFLLQPPGNETKKKQPPSFFLTFHLGWFFFKTFPLFYFYFYFCGWRSKIPLTLCSSIIKIYYFRIWQDGSKETIEIKQIMLYMSTEMITSYIFLHFFYLLIHIARGHEYLSIFITKKKEKRKKTVAYSLVTNFTNPLTFFFHSLSIFLLHYFFIFENSWSGFPESLAIIIPIYPG